MKTRMLILIGLIIFPLFSYAADWKQYPYSDPYSEIQLPEDEGSHHPLLGLEWWYVVVHAVGETTGNKYSILVTHFNNEVRFFTVTNISNKTHKSGTAQGQLNSKAGYLDLTQNTEHGTDFMKTKRDASGDLIPFEYEMETFHSDMHLRAELRAIKPPMMAGGTGYVPIGSSGYSWYYSLTRLDVDGVLTYEGITEPIRGLGWMDHQWGPFLISPVELYRTFETYEWFCVQLDDGSEIMISNIFDRDYNLPYAGGYGGIQYNDPQGESILGLSSTFTRTGYWQDPESGHYMSMGWELDAPDIDMHLVLEPEFKNQMVDFPLNGDFWEGSISVSGTKGGIPVKGRGFGELIHRYEVPQLSVTVEDYPLKAVYNFDEDISLQWKVKNPDAGNPLKYRVELVSAGKSILIAEDITDTFLEFTLRDRIPIGFDPGAFTIKVTGSSVDDVIQGSAESPVLLADGWWEILDKDGVVQPTSFHQRYRRDEFDKNKPFFQWWYFTIKDLEKNRYFAFDYNISDGITNLENEGAYVMFAMVDRANEENFHKYERYPLDNFSAQNDFDITIKNNGDNDFTIQVIDDDTYRVRGKMKNADNVWFSEGCDSDLNIEWDLTIHRIYGWYGQQDIQDIAKAVGLINWNTYAHASEVEGHIIIGDDTYIIDRNEKFRAYGDQNWGVNFPRGNPSIEFPWGWYYAGKPDSDPSKDISIIAGIGRHDLSSTPTSDDNSAPLSVPGMGKFADIRLNSDTHIGVRSIILSPESPEDDNQMGFVTTNDGEVAKFEVKRNNWVEYSDTFGTAMIPLNQKVTIETGSYRTVMDFFSEIENYNRLLFPHEDYIFSDFEALGVDVHVVISSITEQTTYDEWDLLKLFPQTEKIYQTLHDYWTDDGGLEYGYDVTEE